jgi:hypothetical protein
LKVQYTRARAFKSGLFAFIAMTIEKIISTIKADLDNVRSALLQCCDENLNILHYEPKNGWSSLKVLEHITLTSHYLLIIIDKASQKAIQRAVFTPIPEDWDTYELLPNSLEKIGVHKSFQWARPEHMEPSGKVSLNEIKVRMLEQFDRCQHHLLMLRKGEGRLCKTTMSVNAIGKLDVYQYIYFLILHAKRHFTQLEKNRNEFLMN